MRFETSPSLLARQGFELIHNQNEHRIRIAIVQPVQSPYWTERLRAIARHTELTVTLILERAAFAHRPGWRPEAIEGVKIVVLGGVLLGSVREGADLGYRIDGVRSIPWRLPLLLNRLKPDVVVLCNATQLLLSLPLKALGRSRLALIVEDTPHAIRLLSRAAQRIKAAVYRRADAWFAFSDDAKTYLESVGIVRGVRRSSWSVDLEKLDHIGKGASRENQAGPQPIRVSFVGAFIERKGIYQLLRAWAELVMAGTGPLHGWAETFISEHSLHEVKLLGQVPYAEAMKLLVGSDLFVLPTLQDLFSLTVLEAMACRCPVITSPYNGARELLDHGVSGWIVDPTQPGALRGVLECALAMDELELARMGDAAKNRVLGMNNSLVMSRFAEELKGIAER